MNILRRIPITIAVISAMVTVASCETPTSGRTILEETPDRLVLSFTGSTSQGVEFILESKSIAAEHCKKFGKVASLPDVLTQPGPPSIILTYKCDG